jgi:hypothetical protein
MYLRREVNMGGYTVGNMHPTLENKHEEARQEESQVPLSPGFTGFKAMVQSGVGGRYSIRYGTADEGGSTPTGTFGDIIALGTAALDV